MIAVFTTVTLSLAKMLTCPVAINKLSAFLLELMADVGGMMTAGRTIIRGHHIFEYKVSNYL
jgi:hypothetical protein